MKKKLKRSNEFLNQEDLFELANVDHKVTGLPMLIYVSGKNAAHAARVKVARTYRSNFYPGDTFSVLISTKPKIVAGDQGEITNEDVKSVYDWVMLNREILLQYWNHNMSTNDLIDKLKKV